MKSVGPEVQGHVSPECLRQACTTGRRIKKRGGGRRPQPPTHPFFSSSSFGDPRRGNKPALGVSSLTRDELELRLSWKPVAGQPASALLFLSQCDHEPKLRQDRWGWGGWQLTFRDRPEPNLTVHKVPR